MSDRDVLQVALLQLTSSDQIEENSRQILGLLKTIDDPVDLVVLPENALFQRPRSGSGSESGTAPRMPWFRLDDSVFDPFRQWAVARKSHLVIGSVPLIQEDRSSSGEPAGASAMVDIDPLGTMSSPYQKIHLFDVDVRGEAAVRESADFRFGREPAVLTVAGWRFGLSICYDLRFSELFLDYALRKIDGFLVPSAFLKTTGRAHWHILTRARAIESQAYVLAPAQAPGARETFGHSLIVGPWGEILVEQEEPAPAVLRAELRRAELDMVRAQVPMGHHRARRWWQPASVS